jgi:hypothetical protein
MVECQRMEANDMAPIPSVELVVWTENVDEAYALRLDKVVPGISAPHDFLSSLRSAWVMDPDGNPVQIVSRGVGQQAGE